MKIVCAGIYCESAGGAILIDGVFNQTGRDITSCILTPASIITPIWSALAPDLVLSCWSDDGVNWQPGGAWRTLYATLKAAKNATDFVQISAHPLYSSDLSG